MEDDNIISPEFPPPAPPSAAELIHALDQATQSAKQLANAAVNSDQHRMLLSRLQAAQLSLSNFLSLHNRRSPPEDISVSSAGADELMIDENEEEEEESNSKDSSMERVEEKMRDSLHIQNKRPKRPLSPLAAAVGERWGMEERESVRVPAEFDPMRTRLRNLELVYQFHG